MASSSLRPMRRRRISSRPAAASKAHLPSRSTSGHRHRPVGRPDREHGRGLRGIELEPLLLPRLCREGAWQSCGPARCPRTPRGRRRRRPGCPSAPGRRTSPPRRPARRRRSPEWRTPGEGSCRLGALTHQRSPSAWRRRIRRGDREHRRRCQDDAPGAGRGRSSTAPSSAAACHLRHRARPCCSRRGSCWPARCRRRIRASRR